MNKKTYSSVNLTCSFQGTDPFEDENQSPRTSHPSPVISGVISRSETGFRFEESVRTSTDKRNPKLFDGNYCSLVHMQNGKYQIHMKTINASTVKDPSDFAFKVYSELLTAFKVID